MKSASSSAARRSPAPLESVVEESVRAKSERCRGGATHRRLRVRRRAVLLLLRILLLLVGANDDSALVAASTTSQGLHRPVRRCHGSRVVRNGGAVLDVAALVALIGWTLLEAIIIAGISIARREP
jgi:hypothetical protein